LKQADKPGFSWQTCTEIYKNTVQVLKENPTLVILFFIIALLDWLALAVLYNAPSEPFSFVLAPIIRTFWDDRYLHYPQNFVLLPKLFSHAHFLILCTFGLFITGIVIKKIEAHFKSKELSIISASGFVLKKFIPILVAWLASYWFFLFLSKILFKVLPQTNLLAQLAGGFFLALIVQSLTAFILPAILVNNRGFFKDFWQGLKTGARHITTTGLIIAVPVLVIILISFFKALGASLVQSNPEIVLWILAVSIFVSMIVDLIVTSTTTLLFLKVRDKS
jgi:hypothetical protein